MRIKVTYQTGAVWGKKNWKKKIKLGKRCLDCVSVLKCSHPSFFNYIMRNAMHSHCFLLFFTIQMSMFESLELGGGGYILKLRCASVNHMKKYLSNFFYSIPLRITYCFNFNFSLFLNGKSRTHFPTPGIYYFYIFW